MQQLYRARMIVTHYPEDNDFGNKQAPIGDDDIASSITLTGQAVIKHAREIAKKYVSIKSGVTDERTLETVNVAGDTDSYEASTLIKTNYGVFRADELHARFARNSFHSIHGHEIYPVSDQNITVSTFDSKTRRIVAGRVKNLMRHKITKRKFKITVGSQTITMTEDHGCMVYRGDQLIRVRPEDIKPGDKMVVMCGDTDSTGITINK